MQRRGIRIWSSAAGMRPTGTDQLWVADFSYVWTLAGFVYVAFVVDVFSRRILGWRVTTTKHTGMVTDALRQALQVRRRGEHDWVAAGLIHHSDAGSQYVSVAFTAELIAAGIAGSIGTVGDALDNALVRIDHRAVQDRSDQPDRAGLDRPPRRRMAGRPLGPLVQHHPAPLLDRAPAPD